jgi:hypothetical protein
MIFSKRLFSRVILPLAGLVMLSACENPYLVQLKKEFGWTEGRMAREGWLNSCKIASPDIWCYETIGEADCFDAPEKAEMHRLVEKFETVTARAAALPVTPVEPATPLAHVKSATPLEHVKPVTPVEPVKIDAKKRDGDQAIACSKARPQEFSPQKNRPQKIWPVKFQEYARPPASGA